MFYQADLFDHPVTPRKAMDTPALLAIIASASRRPKFAYMLLQLIAEVADEKGRAGPYVLAGTTATPIRDWLCDALVPMAERTARRKSTVSSVRADLERAHRLPADAAEAGRLIDDEVRERIRNSGRGNVSRTVSDLVRIGLLRRHYQGYAIDHENRGAQREAVYTIAPEALDVLRRR